MTPHIYEHASLPASMHVPPTQNTAPVLEFRCLYTQDLRRKQKRWQDGRLKFHTFNKRVMVYDERSNFVGDAHWKEDTEFGDGEELNLERGGVLVEVGECVGKREQDLTELIEKRVKEREERFASKVSHGTPRCQLQHKPLNSLLTPSGHHGRAVVSTQSPFDTRQQLSKAQDENQDERPGKRRKLNEVTSCRSGYAQNLMGATLSLASSKPSGTQTTRYEPVKLTPLAHQKPAATIDLTSDDEWNRTTTNRNAIREEKSAPSKRNTYKPPPVRSTYASNLTGVALTLSRPASSTLQPTINLKPEQHMTQVRDHDREKASSCSEDEEISCPQHSSGNPFKPALDLGPGMTKLSKLTPKKILKPQSSSSAVKHRLEFASSPFEMEENPRRKRHSGKTSAKTIKDVRNDIVELQEPSRKGLQPRLLSPAPTEPGLPPSRLMNNLQKCSINQASGIRPAPERPTTTLKIKSRPARTKMMFMGRTNPRPEATRPLVITTQRTLNSTKSLTISDEPVLSQATIDLNEFSKRQEELLQVRLKKTKQVNRSDERLGSSPVDLIPITNISPKQVAAWTEAVPSQAKIRRDEVAQKQEKTSQAKLNKARPAIALAELSLSPIVSRNDHQTIDLLPSCKALAVPETILASHQEPAQEIPDFSTSVSIEKTTPTEAPNHSSPNAKKDETSMPKWQLPNRKTATPINQARLEDTPPDDLQQRLPERQVPSVNKKDPETRAGASQRQEHPDSELSREKTTSLGGEPRVAIVLVPSSSTYDEHTIDKLTCQVPGISSKPAEPHLKNIVKASIPHLPQVKEINIKLVSLSPRSKTSPTKPLSSAMSSTIQMASERFRKMLKSSASQPFVINQLPSHSLDVSQQGDQDCGPPIDPNGMREGSHCPDVKQPLQPSAIMIDSQVLTDTIGQTPSMDSGAIETPSYNSVSVRPKDIRLGPRAMMTNPATRGKSLQSLAAKTADPLLLQMPPPLSRFASRPETINAKGSMEVGVTSGGGLLPAATSTGPWSREAFDLFGDWRPPGR